MTALRERAVEVMAHALWMDACSEEDLGEHDPAWREVASVALDALSSATAVTPCSTCGGNGEHPRVSPDGWSMSPLDADHETCSGTVSAGPLLVSLLVEAGVLEQAGWINDLGSHGPAAMANAQPLYRVIPEGQRDV